MFGSPAVKEHVIAARRAIGGSAILARVRNLELVRTDERVRIMFPRSYRIDLSGRRKRGVVFDGAAIIGFDANGSRTSDSSTLPNASQIADRGWNNLAQYAIRYLLRPLPSVPYGVKACGTKRFGNIEGVCLEFRRIGGNASLLMLLDPKSFRPVAIVDSYPASRSDPAVSRLVPNVATIRRYFTCSS